MDFYFFEKLSSGEAKIFLDNFLSEAGKGFLNMKPEIEAAGITIDYTPASLLSIFK